VKIIFLSSKFIEPDLSVEFGEILPTEIPLLNKKLFHHQLESVKYLKSDIYITIPIKYDIEFNYSVNKIEIDYNKSLIEVLNLISKQFELTEKLFIYYGDSLLLSHELTDFSKNYLFVQKAKYNYKWGEINNEEYVFAGGILLNNFDLIRALEDSFTFNDFIHNFQKNNNLIFYKEFQWLDFGHSLTYYNSRRQFLETRDFNKIEFHNGFIIKSSKDSFKIWSEYKWLNTFKNYFPHNIPFVTSFDIKGDHASYSLEYLYHPVLSDIFVFGKQPMNFFIGLLKILKNLLIEIKKSEIKFSNLEYANDSFYILKIKERREEIIKCVDKLNFDTHFINNLIENNLKYFNNFRSKYSIMHGDFCFSNILFNFSTYQPILIDPRGYTDKDIGNSFFGPTDYDIFKLAHSFVAGYDLIVSDAMNDEFFSEKNVQIRLNIFIEIFEIDKTHLLMGLKHLFLTMIPLHKNSEKRQEGFLLILNLLNRIC